ncbi:ATP-binding protein [Meridianimarinicoccus sp. RP-17]|uniref:ATP-binding protein n=1 Tax=Meridianimarinicoccus zhengii TaxID=2056810 RepID=UPI000DAC69B2|nr:ATP-binding protein [Phycocomes zhengii]
MDRLRAIGVLDGEAEQAFDRIVDLVARTLGCPVSLVAIIDTARDRQFIKAAHGLPPSLSEKRELPLSHSFCKTVVASHAPVVVPDAREDPRFRDNPAVSELDVIAYLGMPVVDASGQAVGSLCAVSSSPRTWSADDREMVQTLADAVSREIRMRTALAEQRELNAELRAVERRFSDLAANVPGAIFRYILFPDDRDLVEYMSPGCLDIWEVGPEEIENDASRLWEVILPEDEDGLRASIARSAQQMDRWEHRWRIVTPSGRQKWLQGYSTPQRIDDGAILWNALILDVTVEVEAQEKLQRTERFIAEAQKQETIGQLAGGLAHDLNNLLAVVMGNAEVALARSGIDSVDTYLNDIIRSAERGSDILQSVLSFARRSDLRPVVLDMHEVLRGMDNMIRRTVPENIDLSISGDRAARYVSADRGGLENALLNLILNARDAMPHGGKLTVETANVDLGDDYIARRGEDIAPGRYVMLSVSDTGIGIDPMDIDRIFEPFFTTKGKGKGTGLGLSMVQGFSKQSGGTLRVYSERGHGSSFQLFLPALEDAGTKAAEKPQSDAAPGGGRVLLVEDNDDVRKTVRMILDGAGYLVTEAASGDIALTMLDDTCSGFDVVLTDVVMPGKLQGPDLVHVIRDRNPRMPVVFMSGYPHEANVHGNGIRRNDISLTKPMSKAKLLTALGQALSAARNG